MPRRPNNAKVQARYTMVADNNRWEEQGFFFDDSMENYCLEPTIYRTLNELGWFHFARQPARANLNWVLEFYTNNVDGEDSITVRGRRIAANSTTITDILGLPDKDPSIYALLQGLEDEDYETIKDFLCEQGTEWNMTDSRPHSASADSCHNDRLPLQRGGGHCPRDSSSLSERQRHSSLLLHNICSLPKSCGTNQPMRQIHGREVRLVKEGVHAENGCRRRHPHQSSTATPPTSTAHSPATTPVEAGPSTPAKAQPSPAATPHTSPIPNPTFTPAAMPASMQSTSDSPLGSAPTTPSSPPPVQSEEIAPLHILQLQSQLQWIETLKNFLCFQFPSVVAFFTPQPVAMPHANQSIATQPIPSANPLVPAGDTEEVNLSSNDENGIFDWQSLRDHHNPIDPTPTRAEVPETSTTQQTKSLAPTVREVPILSPTPTPVIIDLAGRTTPDASTKRKRKAPAGRTVTKTTHSSLDEGEHMMTRPAKRQRSFDRKMGCLCSVFDVKKQGKLIREVRTRNWKLRVGENRLSGLLEGISVSGNDFKD
ncbi:hypothetical protein GQ457_18G009900 [Hibiscus cannabinus]